MKKPKKLFRSRDNRIVGGVSAGIANYLNIDVVWVRLLFVLLALASGFGILVYIICLLLIPDEPGKKTVKSSLNGRVIIGILLILFGASFLLRKLFAHISFIYMLAGALLVIGLFLVWRGIK